MKKWIKDINNWNMIISITLLISFIVLSITIVFNIWALDVAYYDKFASNPFNTFKKWLVSDYIDGCKKNMKYFNVIHNIYNQGIFTLDIITIVWNSFLNNQDLMYNYYIGNKIKQKGENYE